MINNRSKQLVKLAEKQNVVVTKTEMTAKHIKMFVTNKDSTNDQIIICSKTPGDKRALKKIEAQFKRVARGVSP